MSARRVLHCFMQMCVKHGHGTEAFRDTTGPRALNHYQKGRVDCNSHLLA